MLKITSFVSCVLGRFSQFHFKCSYQLHQNLAFNIA